MSGWKPESRTTIIAAVIVGGSILVGSWQIQSSLDDATDQMEGIRAGLAETKEALKQAAAAPRQPTDEKRRRGPDPNQRYNINTKGAPAKGPASAKVLIAEFSDFQ